MRRMPSPQIIRIVPYFLIYSPATSDWSLALMENPVSTEPRFAWFRRHSFWLIFLGCLALAYALDFFLLYYWPKMHDPKAAPPNWFVAVVFSALVGIGLANADFKFGGFNLQPLSQFLSALEAVVEASISRDVTALRIATNAALRDSLVERLDDKKLEAECILLGLTQTELGALNATAKSDPTILKGLMAAEIIKRSEPDARRLIEEALPAWQRPRSVRGV